MKLKVAMLSAAVAASPVVGYAKPHVAAFQRPPLEELSVDSEGVFLLFEALKPVRNSIANYIIENEKAGLFVCGNVAYQTILARLHHHRSDEATRNSWEFVMRVDGFSNEERYIMWTSLANTSVLLRNFSTYVNGLSNFFNSEEFSSLSNQLTKTSERLLGVVDGSRAQLRVGGLRDWSYPVNMLVQKFVGLMRRLSRLTHDLWNAKKKRLPNTSKKAQSFNMMECNMR